MFLFHDLDGKLRKRWNSLARQGEQTLREQQITLANPGPILQDVQVWMDFVGSEGMVTKSRNACVPTARLAELNQKVSQPIELPLKRALLHDYPNLAGTFILLRVMDLLQMDGNRLAVSPAAWDGWRELNCTEQYFALLEALLFHAQSSVLERTRRRVDIGVEPCEVITHFLSKLSERWLDFDLYNSTYGLCSARGEVPPWSLFVQQQLGLIEIRPRAVDKQQRSVSGGRGWLVGGARLTPWGTGVTWALLERLRNDASDAEEEGGDELPFEKGVARFGFDRGEQAGRRAEAPRGNGFVDDEFGEESEYEDAADETEPELEFGMLQPLFQSYFPEWHNNYARPAREVIPGAHIFRITLTGWRGSSGVWRRLAVPPGTSLDGLAYAILGAFKFDDDHLYDFSYRDQRGKNRIYNRPECQEGPFTSDIAVAELDLALKDEMLFTFDYGDDWKFKVRLEAIDPDLKRLRQPKMIEEVGKAPKQYPDADW